MTSPSTEGGTARRGGGARASAALGLAVLFLGGTFVSAADMHGCPRHHHGPPAAPSSAGESGAEAGAGASGRSADRGASDEGDGTACTCLGDCQSGAPSALHPSPLRIVVDPEPPLAFRPAAGERPGSERHSDYFLPYPLGPPVS